MSDETQGIFEKLKAPFPDSAYKELSFGSYNMTSIDAYHIVERFTEVFGLCGMGWGYHDLTFDVHGDNVACKGDIWYCVPGAPEVKYYVFAVGDGVVMGGKTAEAFKKAQTNLLSKASSFMGVGLSVYKGEGHDDPYVERSESLSAPAPAAPPQQIGLTGTLETAPAAPTETLATAPTATEPYTGPSKDWSEMPECPSCGGSGAESPVRPDKKNPGAYYCWRKVGGCGNTSF